MFKTFIRTFVLCILIYIAALWLIGFFGNLFLGNFGMCAFMVLFPLLAVVVYGKPSSLRDVMWYIHDKK